ncbi:MAG: Ig-like domain-containing protein [Verrucomicrobiota bacterium]
MATYYPTNGFSGSDSFTYKANDGKEDGRLATVQLTVLDVNNPPEVQDRSVVTKLDQPAVIELAATDLDSDAITFTIVAPPTNGTLTRSGTNYLYQPSPGFLGNDSFTFQASDGRDLSRPAKVSIRVTDQNTAPTAEDFSVRVLVNTPTNITFKATDPESNPLNYHLVTRPKNGKLSGKGQTVLYSPNPYFVGSDRFTFRVDDGDLESNVGTVTLSVEPANHRPVATNQEVIVIKNQAKLIDLAVQDSDGDLLRCPILKGPKNGRLAGLGTRFTYTPKPGFVGSDIFTYKAWDGQIYSVEGTVLISVAAEPPAPSIRFQSVNVLSNGDVQLVLTIPSDLLIEVVASSDLVNWAPLPTGGLGPAANGKITVLDRESSRYPHRFYRARQLELTSK